MSRLDGDGAELAGLQNRADEFCALAQDDAPVIWVVEQQRERCVVRKSGDDFDIQIVGSDLALLECFANRTRSNRNDFAAVGLVAGPNLDDGDARPRWSKKALSRQQVGDGGAHGNGCALRRRSWGVGAVAQAGGE